MTTLLALPVTTTSISAIERTNQKLDFTAVVCLSEERAVEMLEYVTHMKYVRSHWPDAWGIFAFEPEGPLFLPISVIQVPANRHYVILSESFTPHEILSTESNALLITSEGASWQTTDSTNSFNLNTREIDDRLLRLLASGIPLRQGTDAQDSDINMVNAFLLDPESSIYTH